MNEIFEPVVAVEGPVCPSSEFFGQKGATIDDAILCKTKMPWGEENGDCQ